MNITASSPLATLPLHGNLHLCWPPAHLPTADFAVRRSFGGLPVPSCCDHVPPSPSSFLLALRKFDQHDRMSIFAVHHFTYLASSAVADIILLGSGA